MRCWSLCEEAFFPVLTPIHTPVPEEELQLHPTPIPSLEEPAPVINLMPIPVQAELERKNSPRKRLASFVSVVNDEHHTEDDVIAPKKIRDLKSCTEARRDFPRIPFKQLQERSSHRDEYERPATQPRDQYHRDDDRSRSRRSTSRHHSSSHRRPFDRLTEEERRWLDKMPSAWRRH